MKIMNKEKWLELNIKKEKLEDEYKKENSKWKCDVDKLNKIREKVNDIKYKLWRKYE